MDFVGSRIRPFTLAILSWGIRIEPSAPTLQEKAALSSPATVAQANRAIAARESCKALGT